jgi:hypothetical protein
MEVIPNITSIRFTFFDWFSLYPATFVLQANYWQIKKDYAKRLGHRGFKPGRCVSAMEVYWKAKDTDLSPLQRCICFCEGGFASSSSLVWLNLEVAWK